MKQFLEKLKRVKSLDDLKKLLKSDKKEAEKLALLILVVAIIGGQYFGRGDEEVTAQIEEPPETQILAAEAVPEIIYYVDIAGEVRCPGVYEVNEGARLFEVISLAGGLTQDADTSVINQAEPVADGVKIYIPSHEEIENSDYQQAGSFSAQVYSPQSGGYSANVSSGNVNQSNFKDKEGRININLADETTLQELPGIGPAKSAKIVEYRNQNGAFQSVDDIIKVNGIGEKTLASIRDLITV